MGAKWVLEILQLSWIICWINLLTNFFSSWISTDIQIIHTNHDPEEILAKTKGENVTCYLLLTAHLEWITQSICFRVPEVGKELFDMMLWKLETPDLEYFRPYQYIVLLTIKRLDNFALLFLREKTGRLFCFGFYSFVR